MDYSALRSTADKEWQALEKLNYPLIHIGMGTCGQAAGAQDIYNAAKKTLTQLNILGRVLKVGCIGLCYLEPIMAVRKPGQPFVYYGNLTAEKTSEILESYLLKDDPKAKWAIFTLGQGSLDGILKYEEHPMISPQVRIALRNCGIIDPENINHYIARGGYSGLKKALAMTPEEVISEIKMSGLRGRGGGGFPTGLKWEFTRKSPGKTKYIICNADEGDPGAFMDRSLLEGDPHSVLEGMLIGAYAFGARDGYVYARAEYPLAIARLEIAMQQMEKYHLLGEHIFDSEFSFSIYIKQGAGAFVCGEETALMASIQGGRGMPRARPPFPAQVGLWGKPTNINNVETFSNVSAILEKGATWFASYGTEKSRGTKTFSLAGKINRTGLIEVPMGMTLNQIVNEIGGGVMKSKKLKAIQTGGPSGGCIPSDLCNIPVDYDSLTGVGSIMGSGGLIVMDEDTCMVDMARYFLAFTQSESCGKCMPCRLGTKQMLEILEDICEGNGKEDDLEILVDIGEAVRKGSLCGLGQTAPNPVQSTLRYFKEEYEAHVRRKKCPAGTCKPLFYYAIDSQKCKGCLKCMQTCPSQAITGEKKQPHVIHLDKCTKCGLCYQTCKFQAVIVQ